MRSLVHYMTSHPAFVSDMRDGSSDAATQRYKASPLASSVKTSRPKIATVTPLPPTKKPSLQVQPSVKKTKEATEVIPPLSKDFLDITNPAHFSWYLPYYASLGLANMMMVPFLSNQMKKNDGEVEEPKSNPNTEDIEAPTTPPPLDLSKTNTFQKSPPPRDHASTASHESSAAPLDLSRKPSNVIMTNSTGSEAKKVKSRRKSTPRMNAAGFLNPSLNAISKWTIEEVVSFVNSVDGCQKYTQVVNEMSPRFT